MLNKWQGNISRYKNLTQSELQEEFRKFSNKTPLFGLLTIGGGITSAIGVIQASNGLNNLHEGSWWSGGYSINEQAQKKMNDGILVTLIGGACVLIGLPNWIHAFAQKSYLIKLLKEKSVSIYFSPDLRSYEVNNCYPGISFQIIF